MCCPIVRAVTLRPLEPEEELTCRSEDPAPHAWFPSHAGRSPRTPSVVFRAHEPKPMNDVPGEPCSDPLDTPAPIRLLSIRARTSGGATDFFLASALLDHRPTLRSTGEEDARCVEPTSATHTKYVHPHLARSRLTSLVTQRGRPTETKAPYDTIGGPSVSRHSKTASADQPSC
jgi:hypothetical protein